MAAGEARQTTRAEARSHQGGRAWFLPPGDLLLEQAVERTAGVVGVARRGRIGVHRRRRRRWRRTTGAVARYGHARRKQRTLVSLVLDRDADRNRFEALKPRRGLEVRAL